MRDASRVISVSRPDALIVGAPRISSTDLTFWRGVAPRRQRDSWCPRQEKSPPLEWGTCLHL